MPDNNKTALQRAQEMMMSRHNTALRCAKDAALDALVGTAGERTRQENEAKLWKARAETYEECARIIGTEAMRDMGLPV